MYRFLAETYNPKISRTTVQNHLKNLTMENVIGIDRERGRNNERYYSLSNYAKRQLGYYGYIEHVKSRREGRKKSKEEEKLEDERGRNGIAMENEHIVFLNLLLQAADGSGRFVSAHRTLLPGEIELPVTFERLKGVTVQDIVGHKDIGNGELFRHIRFTESIVQLCIDVLERKYGIDLVERKTYDIDPLSIKKIEKTQIIRNESGDLIKNIVRTDGGTNETGIAIKDMRLKDFINIIGCLIFVVEDRMKYIWLYKRKPKLNSWEVLWYTTLFGKERTLELIEKSEYTRPSLKNKNNKQKLWDYIRKNIESEWSRTGRKIDHALINKYIQDKIKTILHDKRFVDSLIRQTDRHITRLYRERIRCDSYEKIFCDKHDYSTRCEKCQKFHDKYEEYRRFAIDVLTNPNNKSNALITPLLKVVYPLQLRKLHKLVTNDDLLTTNY
jgi:hypothetical protein